MKTKTSTFALTALVATALLGGCASTPKTVEPKKLDEVGIQAGDSFALQLLKLSGTAMNASDKTLTDEEWKKINGADSSVMALNMASGAAGIGMLGGSGLSGGMLNAGLSILASKNKDPYPIFSLIQVIPVEQLATHSQVLGDYLGKNIGTNYRLQEESFGSKKFLRLQVVGYDGYLATSKKYGDWGMLMGSVNSPISSLSSEQAAKLFNREFPTGNYVVVSSDLSYCAELPLFDRLIKITSEYPSFLYVPPKIPSSTKHCLEADKLRANYQQVIDLNSKDIHLLLKPQAI
ncbi:hypothetical protein L5M38_23855 [Shewanella sp. SM101]|jgi:hypothetical protein|uniref:hypothetical protein n=1 Tax=Shewanella TaxID=22 RepID=UPI0021D985E0|nr:hypothetical protein [Shewanella sp. SM101]MCU8107515.1 hypothetical protein [Shewanella sp. SM101]